MISIGDAERIIASKRPEEEVIGRYSTPKYFIFELLPSNAKNQHGLVDCMVAVTRSNGKFLEYSPLTDLDDFRKISPLMAHHGIVGMHWGERNGPPYPLKAHSPRENFLRSALENNKRKREQRKIYAKELSTFSIRDGKKSVTDYDHHWRDVIVSTLPDGSKEIKNIVEDILSKGVEEVATRPQGWSSSDIKKVNPGKGAPGRTQNCLKCTAAYELRKYGLDVIAGRQQTGTMSEGLTKWFNGAKMETIEGYKSLTDKFKSFGPGSSGCFTWDYKKMNSGHAMHWSIDDKGNFFIDEAQGGYRHKLGNINYQGKVSSMLFDQTFKSYASARNVDLKGLFDVARLDNCTPNWNAILEDNVVTNEKMSFTKSFIGKEYRAALNVDTGEIKKGSYPYA